MERTSDPAKDAESRQWNNYEALSKPEVQVEVEITESSKVAEVQFNADESAMFLAFICEYNLQIWIARA